MNNIKRKICAVLFCILLVVSVVPIIEAVVTRSETQVSLAPRSMIQSLFGSSFLHRVVSVNGSSFEVDIQGGRTIRTMITNIGTSEVNGVPWSLSVSGGFFGQINRSVSGLITLAPGGSVTIVVGSFLGFGLLSIRVRIAQDEQTMTGVQVLSLTLLKKSRAFTLVRKESRINSTVTPPVVAPDSSFSGSPGGSEPVVPSVPKTNPVYYTLTIDVDGNGSVTPSSSRMYLKGTEVDISATPDAGWVFSEWSGDSTGSDAQMTLTMNADKKVNAHFKRSTVKTYTLTVTAGAGGTTSPSGVQTYSSGAIVECAAIPDAGFHFMRWRGDYTGTNNPYRLTLRKNYQMTALFEANPVDSFALTTTVVGAGCSVLRNPNQAVYVAGTVVTVTAVPATGWTFSSWGGAANGSSKSVTVTMNADKTVTATFIQNTYTLTTSVNSGMGAITKTPSYSTYTHGTPVTVTATPTTGYFFAGWSGDVTGSTNPLTITMNGDKTVRATFSQNTYTLSTSVVSGVGTITKTPSYSSYPYGSVVSLTATPSEGYVFGSWGGDTTGITPSKTLTITKDNTVTATFIKKVGLGKQVKTFLVAYFTPSVTQQQYIAEHIDLVNMGGNDNTYATIGSMKALNPALKVITYRELCGEYGPPSASTYDDWQIVNAHEDWFLHSLSGSRLVSAGSNYHYFMNPNPAVGWNQYGANVIFQYLTAYPLLDGVFLDNAGRFMGSFGSTGNVLDILGNHVFLTDIPQNIQSFYPFSRNVKTGDWIFSAIDTVINKNPGRIIMGNSGLSWDLADDLGMWLCIEGFSDDKHWSTQAYQLSVLNEIDVGITQDTSIGVICRHSLAPTSANREAIRFWAISSYTLFCLVLKDPAKSYFCFQSTYGNPYPADPGYWFSEFDTPLGEPLGPKQLIAGNANDGVYMRRFENATILRNLSMGGGQGTQKTYTVTVDGVQYTLEPEQGKIII